MQIELNIDSLALTGFPAMDFPRFGAALQTELGRLFEERGVPARLEASWRAAEIQLGQLILPGGAEPELAAAYVARALYDGLNAMPFK